MTALSITALLAGTVILMLLPVPRVHLHRVASKAAGTLLFGLGLGGVIYGLFAPAV